MEPYQYVLLTLVAVLVLKFLVMLIMGKGSLARLGLAYQAFGRVMGDAATAERVVVVDEADDALARRLPELAQQATTAAPGADDESPLP